MKDIDAIRRDNMRLIEKEAGGTTEAATLCGMSPSQFINLRDGAKDSKTGKQRGMRKETARRIEESAKKPAGWHLTCQTRSAHRILSRASCKALKQVAQVLLLRIGLGFDVPPAWHLL